MSAVLVEHADAAALAETCAQRLAQALDAALATRGRAVLALAGGRTAPPVFARLAAGARDWSRVTLLPTDERWVGADHPDSNLSALRAAFARAHGAGFVGLTPGRAADQPDASFGEAALAAYAAPFDATLLGMGADGHFASLFPGATTLEQGLDPTTTRAVVPIVPDPLPAAGPHPRVSLTLARLLRSRCVVLAITGADKRETLRRAQAGADPLRLPVAALLAAAPALEVHWSP